MWRKGTGMCNKKQSNKVKEPKDRGKDVRRDEMCTRTGGLPLYGVEKAHYFSPMNENAGDKKVLQVSANFRWMENLHILLWLLKDFCWALEFKTGGIIMVIPTVSVAVYITWRSRYIRSELFHNLAVCCWITANSVWMIGEFFAYDEPAKHAAACIFGIGILLLAYYYARFFKKDRKKEKELNT
jgi:hypothetical protein